MKRPIETEIKLSIPDAAGARALLRRAGFKIRRRRVFERNILLDDEGGSLRSRGLLLRVRSAAQPGREEKVTCTFKGRALPGRHKRRNEEEFGATGLHSCLAVFAGIGFRETFRYEKYRTEFGRADEDGHVTLDETPIGTFMELEGQASWIDRTAEELGFPRKDWITFSYGTLYLEWCARNKRKPGSMTFPKPR